MWLDTGNRQVSPRIAEENGSSIDWEKLLHIFSNMSQHTSKGSIYAYKKKYFFFFFFVTCSEKLYYYFSRWAFWQCIIQTILSLAYWFLLWDLFEVQKLRVKFGSRRDKLELDCMSGTGLKIQLIICVASELSKTLNLSPILVTLFCFASSLTVNLSLKNM